MEALKYSQVAAAASVSRQTAKACIFGTTSLVSHCLKKGENIAFVLKDIGVLLIEGTRVHVKFYYDFLERISGKENLEKVVFKVSCRFLHGLGSPTSPELPAHGSPGAGRLLGPCESCAAVSSSCPQCLSRDEDVPHPPLLLPCRSPGC